MSLLGIDIGTTGCKAVAYDLQGRQLAVSYREYEIISSEKGFAELDTNNVWMKVLDTIKEVAQKTKYNPVESLSVSSIGEAMVPVSYDRKILGNSILSIDNRGKEYIEQLLDIFSPYEIYKHTGNLPDTFFSVSKLVWLKNHKKKLYHNTDYFLPWADFVCFMLGGKPIVSNSLASRTLLLDLKTGNWSKELLSIFNLDATKLAPLGQSGNHLGFVNKNIAGKLGLKSNVAIISGGHDQCCAVLGSGVKNDSYSVMYGMGTFICVASVFSQMPDINYMFQKKMHIEPHVVPGYYITFIYNQSGGALVKWFRNIFGGKQSTYSDLFEEIPCSPNSIIVLPKFGATGPPDFYTGNQGCFFGLDLSHSRGDILQAILEGIVFYVKDCFEKLSEIFDRTNTMVATGGGSISDKWLQITADILNKNVTRNKVTEASSLGAAIIAGVGSKIFTSFDEATEIMIQKDKTYTPDNVKIKHYRNKFKQYKKLYNSLLLKI
jgi:xylulokinase